MTVDAVCYHYFLIVKTLLKKVFYVDTMTTVIVSHHIGVASGFITGYLTIYHYRDIIFDH